MEIFLIVEVFVNIEMILIHRIVCCRLYFFAFVIFSDLITKRPWMWIRQNVNREKYASNAFKYCIGIQYQCTINILIE